MALKKYLTFRVRCLLGILLTLALVFMVLQSFRTEQIERFGPELAPREAERIYITRNELPEVTYQTLYNSEPKLVSTKPSPVAVELPFSVIEKKWNAREERYAFYRIGMDGKESRNINDVRRFILSENQANYPEPESACGPIALLNLYVWYAKFGLIKESVQHADLRAYKQLKFKEIDQKIAGIRGRPRDGDSGTNSIEQVMAMDALLQENGPSNLRLHSSFKLAPLTHADFAKVSIRYRAGILSAYPLDLQTGQLLPSHAVLVVRADTSGTITIANWGEFIHCRLVNKPDGQWLIPNDTRYHPLKIIQLTSLIPFKPKA
jgi:hypothetical protein